MRPIDIVVEMAMENPQNLKSGIKGVQHEVKNALGVIKRGI